MAEMDFWDGLFAESQGDGFLEHNACPSCDGTESEAISRLGPTFLKRCRSCRLVYSSPRLSGPLLDAMYRRNPGTMDPKRDRILERLMSERLRTMRREMFPLEGRGESAGSLFEIGSGWGHFLNLARADFGRVSGVELSSNQAAFARGKFSLEISERDIFEDASIPCQDVIAAWELLEHLPHPRKFLAWSFAHLRPGGQLALSTPNYDSLYRRLLGPHWFYFIPSQHLTYFSPRSIKALLREVGFADVEVRTSGRSLLRERRNRHNRIDLNLPVREQWLQTLRIRDEVELARERAALDKGTLPRRLWHSAIWRLVNPLVVRGWGDQMRVYARKR